jgi:uncharacterized membrane protein YoaK (UPF0700 family)
MADNKSADKVEVTEHSLDNDFLECERRYIFALLMFVGGFYGAYTYSIRGGVFCNAQTANFVLFAMAVGSKNWHYAAYLLIPMTAYLSGAVISEAIAGPIRKHSPLRWDTLLIVIEIIAVIFLGFLPETAPYQIAQVTINFICSMQYNTFRQTEKIPMATVFCTNHLRQTGIALVKSIKNNGESKHISRCLAHASMLFVFVLGGILSTVLCHIMLGKAIWVAIVPLGIVLFDLLYADLKKEKDKHHIIPNGH